MMKKFYYSLFAAATMLLATTSCSDENSSVPSQNNEITTFKVALQGVTGSRTAGDGLTVDKLYYAAYDKAGQKVIYPNPETEGKNYLTAVITEEGTAQVNLPLMKSEEYDIVFWAQTDGTNAYSFEELTDITVNYPTDGTLLSNQENRDAFFNTLNNFKAEGKTQEVKLYRPFGQLNVATAIADWNEALRQYQANGNTDYPVKYSEVTISKLATTFNAMTGEASGETTATVTFGKAEILDESIFVGENEDEYKLLAMNYLLMNAVQGPTDVYEHHASTEEDKDIVDLIFSLWKDADNKIVQTSVPSVPIQRNYRTNILGSFLTGDATQFNIVIDAKFDGDHNEKVGFVTEADKKIARIYSAEGLEYFRDLVNGTDSRAEVSGETFKGWTVYLENNIELNKNEEWEPIGNTTNYFQGTFDGKGKTVSNIKVTEKEGYAGFFGYARATIKNFTVENVTITANHYAGGIVGQGYCRIEDCHAKKVDITLTIKDGDWGDKAGGIIGQNNEGGLYVKNCTAENVTIKGYRDLGGIAGMAHNNNTVSDCSVKDITIIQDLTDGYKETTPTTLGAVVGRKGTNVTSENNTEENAYIATASEDVLATMLTADTENISIKLIEDTEIAISSLGQQTGGSGEYKLGGENTKNITIDLNGKKLTISTTYWSVLGAKNADALFTIKNGTMTSSQASGTWNSYDLCFANCNYVFEDVVFEKAIALESANKEFTLKNVTINETHDYYAMWISAKGQTLNIDGLTINSDGRGIKIDEQYVNAPEKVTMNIKNSTIKSAKKAAIVVKSAAGAEINVENLNISEVAADDFNAVWVDEDAASYAELVKVTGANVIVEGTASVGTTDEFKAAVSTPGALIQVEPGTYTFPSGVAEGVTINCLEGTVFTGNSKLNINGATVIGATFSNPEGTAVDQTINGTFKNCTFTGKNALRWCYAGETVVFENCVFSGDVYGVHFDGGANEAIFKNCTFSGFNAFGGAITLLTLDGCTFKANGKSNYNGANLWGSTKAINCNFEFDGSVEYEWIDLYGAEGKTYEFTGCKINEGTILRREYFGAPEKGINATVDGTVYENVNNITFLANTDDMAWFANEVNVEGETFAGKELVLSVDIDMTGINWTPVGQTGATQFKGIFNGNNKTISNLNIDKTAETGGHYSTGLFGWLNKATVKNVKVDGATVKGNHNVGVIAGYMETAGCTIDNCHVTNAAVECHVANDDANGDKAGIIVGHAGNAGVVVSNCSATDSSLSAGRDAGQIAGAAKEANVTSCSATNVTVTANGEGTGKNIRNEVIGRVL